MPFRSEKQRKYLWANEPEIARDWTDIYGSGIAKALGGRINRAEGGINWSQFDDAENEWNAAQGFEDADKEAAYDAYVAGLPTLKNKWSMSNFNLPNWNTLYSFGSGLYDIANKSMPWGWGKSALNFMGRNREPVINPATQQFMNKYNIGRNLQTGRMMGGPFAGQNLPGTSMFGSKTPQEMAQKWVSNYGDMEYKTKKQQQKQIQMQEIAGENGGTGSSGGGAQAAGDLAGDSAYNSPFNRGGLAALWQR